MNFHIKFLLSLFLCTINLVGQIVEYEIIKINEGSDDILVHYDTMITGRTTVSETTSVIKALRYDSINEKFTCETIYPETNIGKVTETIDTLVRLGKFTKFDFDENVKYSFNKDSLLIAKIFYNDSLPLKVLSYNHHHKTVTSFFEENGK